ncbi:MAG: hypothetical protein A4E65_01055 [Syntrophorhabdus sp. PtaU1.Bin153]|nr:MAG: hypothetical protein A4E65_01055 [Syntrophorhabdus sp. PtaU1.Bin153]
MKSGNMNWTNYFRSTPWSTTRNRVASMTDGTVVQSRRCGGQGMPGLWALLLCLLIFPLFLPGAGYCAQATLAWNPNTEANVTGYKVYYGTTSRDYDWFVDVGKVTTYTVANLTDGVRYYFAATAYDSSSNESAYSEEVSSSACTYSISATSASYTSSANSGSVAVTAPTGCSWTATSSASWLTVASGNTGSGNGTVRYSVAANTSTSLRTATITIAGRTFTVTQQGTSSATSCTYSVAAANVTVPASATTASVRVTTQTGCSWTATSGASWLRITSGSTGSGSGSVTISIAANTSRTSRSTTVTIAGRSFTVTQRGI